MPTIRELREKASRARATQSSPNYGPGGQGSGSAGFSGSMSEGYLGEGSDFSNTNLGSNNTGDNNTGINSFLPNAPGGSGGNEPYNATIAAKNMLGNDYYNKALKYMSAQELNDQIAKAQSYGRGINLSQFKADLDKFDAFQSAGGGPVNIDGTTFLGVSDPLMTANAPTLSELLGDIGGGIGDMLGAGANFILGGGTTGKILKGFQDKFNQGKNFVGELTNPNNLSQRLDSAGPEAKRLYALYLNQGDPYQVAFQKATGQSFAHGGVANL